MNDRYLASTSVTRYSNGSTVTSIPVSVRDLLGEADRVCWFLDEDTGLVYLVPDSEVSLR